MLPVLKILNLNNLFAHNMSLTDDHDDDDLCAPPGGGEEEELSLPRASINKIIKEIVISLKVCLLQFS